MEKPDYFCQVDYKELIKVGLSGLLQKKKKREREREREREKESRKKRLCFFVTSESW